MLLALSLLLLNAFAQDGETTYLYAVPFTNGACSLTADPAFREAAAVPLPYYLCVELDPSTRIPLKYHKYEVDYETPGGIDDDDDYLMKYYTDEWQFSHITPTSYSGDNEFVCHTPWTSESDLGDDQECKASGHMGGTLGPYFSFPLGMVEWDTSGVLSDSYTSFTVDGVTSSSPVIFKGGPLTPQDDDDDGSWLPPLIKAVKMVMRKPYLDRFGEPLRDDATFVHFHFVAADSPAEAVEGCHPAQGFRLTYDTNTCIPLPPFMDSQRSFGRSDVTHVMLSTDPRAAFPTPQPTPKPTSIPAYFRDDTTTEDGGSSLSAAAVAAIVGGVLACLCLLCAAGLVAALAFRRARGSSAHAASSTVTPARAHTRSRRTTRSDSRAPRRVSTGTLHRA
jgi:hypothetical protein